MTAMAIAVDLVATVSETQTKAGESMDTTGMRRGVHETNCAHLTSFFETKEGRQTLAVLARCCVKNTQGFGGTGTMVRGDIYDLDTSESQHTSTSCF
ncbi:hypothetical protein N9L76_05545 [bacterium]|nr:hypothetical protein [bacterium]